MQLTIKNKELVRVSNFLYGLSLKPKLSRYRGRLNRLIMEKIEDLQAESEELIRTYAIKDGNNPVLTEDGEYQFEPGNLDVFMRERVELDEELITIDLSTYPGLDVYIKQILDELDVELSEEDAIAYDFLCDVFEV